MVARFRLREWGDLSAAVWVSIAVCSSQYPSSCREYADRRVRVRGCGAWPWAVGGRRSRGAARNEEAKYVFFTHLYHTQKSEPATRSGNRAPSLLSSVPSRLQSPKSSERAQSPISRRAPSTGARGTCAGSLCGRGWVVRCPCFNFKFGTGRRAAPNNSRLQFSERGPRARCERKKRTRWPTPDS